jgi:hypothetical protein
VSICATLCYEVTCMSLLRFEVNLCHYCVVEAAGSRHGVDKAFALLGCYAVCW